MFYICLPNDEYKKYEKKNFNQLNSSVCVYVKQ